MVMGYETLLLSCVVTCVEAGVLVTIRLHFSILDDKAEPGLVIHHHGRVEV